MLSPEAVLFLAVSGFMAVLIPREAYRRVFPAGFCFGVLGPLAVATVLRPFGVRLSSAPFLVASLNIWLLLAWVPLLLIYLHFLPTPGSWVFWAYVLSFAAFTLVIWRSFAYAHRVANLHPLLVLALALAAYALVAYLYPWFEPGPRRQAP